MAVTRLAALEIGFPFDLEIHRNCQEHELSRILTAGNEKDEFVTKMLALPMYAAWHLTAFQQVGT